MGFTMLMTFNGQFSKQRVNMATSPALAHKFEIVKGTSYQLFFPPTGLTSHAYEKCGLSDPHCQIADEESLGRKLLHRIFQCMLQEMRCRKLEMPFWG